MPLATQKRHSGSSEGFSRIIGVLAGLVGLGAIAGVVWYNLTHSPADIDKETLCPRAGPWSTTVVLIDASDPLPPIAQDDVKNQIADEVRKTPKFGLLELRLLNPDVSGGQALFSRCNPGDGRELSEIVANPEHERKRFEADFEAPLEEQLSSAVLSDPTKTSPIMETIQWIAVNRFGRSNQQKEKPRLIIISDMLQHSTNYSLYKGDSSFDRYRRSPSYEALRTDLHEAGATVLYVHRQSSSVVDDDLVEFWEQWFSDNNGSLNRVKKIQGAR